MKTKVLIIDDNLADQLSMQEMLINAGFDYDFITADSGEEGLEKAKIEMPDIILLDTLLPGVNGFEICRIIKEDTTIDAKIIVFTGEIDYVNSGKAREIGADGYCIKTSDCEPLIEVLNKLNKKIKS